MKRENPKGGGGCADCFALTQLRECGVLTSTDFDGQPCPFYKTRAQLASDRRDVDVRLVSLYHVTSADVTRRCMGNGRISAQDAQIT